MPTEVGIHVYLRVSLNRRGWRAFARHDDEEWAVSQSLHVWYYSPNSFFAFPPAIAARSASLSDATDAMWPSGSYSAMSYG
jgi:hypothetical protein